METIYQRSRRRLYKIHPNYFRRRRRRNESRDVKDKQVIAFDSSILFDPNIRNQVTLNRVVKRTHMKVFLKIESLKPNIQTLLRSMNMIVICEISKLEDFYAEEDMDEYGVSEGESYMICICKNVQHLGYFKNSDFNMITFYEPGSTLNT